MSRAWHCDREGCDAWTKVGYRHGFVKVYMRGGHWHFCSWDCVIVFGAKREPLVEVPGGS